MTFFEHLLWGYRLEYPDGWLHHTQQSVEQFAARLEALDEDYRGPQAGKLLVRAELNSQRQDLEPLWNKQMGLLAGLLGAKKVGSAPWKMAGALGIEAEVVLPKRENRRLWAGILGYDFLILHFLVTHPLEARAEFEPAATRIISSLSFPTSLPGFLITPDGLPLPPGYTPVDPQQVISDIVDPAHWSVYTGASPIDALQLFYLREAHHLDWAVEEYAPFPGASEIGFARFRLRRGDQTVVLGLLPQGKETVNASSPAHIAIRRTP